MRSCRSACASSCASSLPRSRCTSVIDVHLRRVVDSAALQVEGGSVNNYEFCADWIVRSAPIEARVLDYGCGSGHTIRILRDSGIDAHGCDVYYGESSIDANAPETLRP